MKAASLAGPSFDRLMEVQSRPFSIKLSEDAGLPFSMPRKLIIAMSGDIFNRALLVYVNIATRSGPLWRS